MFVNSFLLQTNQNYVLHFIHDGVVSLPVNDLINHYRNFCDIRIIGVDPPTGAWGHINRARMLSKIDPNEGELLLITNFDNYYVPVFVDTVLSNFNEEVDLLYYDFVHSHQGYQYYNSFPEISKIDMGAFITKTELAKQVGFNSTHYCADGFFLEDYKKAMSKNMRYVKRALFVHN
jgi:hypothetical protein